MVQNLPINNIFKDILKGTSSKNGQGRTDNPRNLNIVCFKRLDIEY